MFQFFVRNFASRTNVKFYRYLPNDNFIDMDVFFNNMDPLLRMFWYIVIPASVLFIIQIIATFIGGGDHDHGGDHAVHHQFFSLRNLTNFLLGFGWTGISLYSTLPAALLVPAAFIIGAAFVMMYFVIIRQLMKLSEDNSFKITNTIGKTAEVYLAIPEHHSGIGKVLISVGGSVHELDAMTESGRIASGAIVQVIRVESDNTVIVEET